MTMDFAANGGEPANVIVSRRRLPALLGGPRLVTLADQMLSSVSNVLAVILVARVLSAADFGRFSLGYAALTLTLGLSRAYFGTQVSLAPDSPSGQRLTGALVAALTVLSPLAVVAVFAVSALASGGHALGILLLVAFATPIVCVQDLLRFGAAAGGRAWSALLSDAAWVAIMAVPFVLRLSLSSTMALALWMSAAVVALLLALATAGVRPDLGRGLAALRTRHRVGASVTVGAAITSVGTLWILLLVSGVITPAAAGSLRGASTTMGPVNVLIAFCGLGLTPALLRRRRSRDLIFCAATAAVMASLTLLWGTVLLLLPHSAGVAGFGKSWDGIRAVLPWTLLEYLAVCCSSAAILGLKVRHDARAIVRQRATAGAVTVLGGSAVALVLGKTWTVAATLAAAAAVSASLGWIQLSRGRAHAAPGADLSEHGPVARHGG